jgi:two-component system cell cycle sensor histidine kinase/response regulator CckA
MFNRPRKEKVPDIYKSLVERIPAVTYIAGFEQGSHWVYVSPQIRTLLGYTAEEWKENPGLFYERVHPDDRTRVLEGERESKSSGQFSSEYRMIRKDSSIIWVRDEGVIRKGSYYGFLFDITREKENELKATENEQRHNELLEDIDAIVWDADPITFRATYVSEKAVPMLGYPIEDWYKENFWLDHVLADDRESVWKIFSDAVADPKETYVLFEYRFFTAEDEIRWLRDQAHIIRDPEGKALRIRGITLDITDEKEKEAERTQMEDHIRATHKFEAIGRLAGGVAHDFNNLLMAITSFCELLKMKMPNASLELDEIQKAAEQGSGLTRHLLAFGGKQIHAKRPVNLNQVFTDLEPMLKRMIREDVELKIYPDERLGVIQGDPGHISEIIINLAVTARESMPEGGKLILESSNQTVERLSPQSGLMPGEYIRLTITDTGAGLDDETKAHIFEPFFAGKARSIGSGLRIPAVYGIVKQTGGSIFVEAAPGQGTSFKIYFPRIDSVPETVQKKISEIPSAFSGNRILIVDDNDAVRVAISAYLEMNGFQTEQAENGKEAVRVASGTEKIDVLITDLVMPQMGGIELSQELISRNPKLKILYMSGYTEDSVIREGMLEPGAYFIQKPASMQVLLQKVRDLLGGV